MNRLSLIASLLIAVHQCASTDAVSQSLNTSDPCERVRALAPEVALLRKLPIVRELKCIAANKESFADIQAKHLERIISRERLEAEESSFKLLGLIPNDYSYAECAAKSSLQYIQAFYDIFERRIVIPTDRETSDDVLAHELVHALQDQHFNLQAISEKALKTTDTGLAMASVAEGDARAIQANFRANQQVNDEASAQESDQESDCQTPAPLEDIDLFAYTFGALFVDRVIESGGLAALNQAIKTPPKATAQIIHRAYYPKFSPGFVVSKAPAAIVRDGINYRLRHQDTLGQYVIRVILGISLDSSAAITAAKGWRGDTLALYSGAAPSDRLLVWKISWLNEQEAREFHRAFMNYLSKLHAATLRLEASALQARIGENKWLSLAIRGSTVIFEMRA